MMNQYPNKTNQIENGYEKNQWIFAAPMSFVSGMIIGLITAASGFWLKSLGISYKNITLLNIARFANPFRMIWVPIFDSIDFDKILSKFGIRFSNSVQRKAAIFVCSTATFSSLIFCSFLNPKANLSLFIGMIFMANFWHINAESLMNAYNIETLQPKSMGITTAAFRFGIFVSNSIFIVLNREFKVDWNTIFMISSLVGLGIIYGVLLNSPKGVKHEVKTLKESLTAPLTNLIKTYRWSVLNIVLFVIMYQASEKIGVALGQFFLLDGAGLSPIQYFCVRLIAVFLLVLFSAKSNALIDRFGYTKSFMIAVLINIGAVSMYYFHSFNSEWSYAVCVLIGIAIFGFVSRITKSNVRVIGTVLASISIGFVCIAKFADAKTMLMFGSIMLVLGIDKMVSGIKNSILYGYKASLCDKKYVLGQISIFEGLFSMFSVPLQVYTGRIYEDVCHSSWNNFYLLNMCVASLPLIFLVFRPKILNNAK